MYSRYAVIEYGAVVNVVMWDGETEWDGHDAAVALAEDSPVHAGYTYDGATFTAPAAPAASIPSAQELSDGIDSLVADIYSNWTRFQQEYLMREQAAQAFKDAGYAGDPGVWVSAFATAAGTTSQAAADLILTQAGGLNAALESIGAQRMRKYEVLSASTPAAAQDTYNDIVTKINAIAAALG